MPAALWAVTHEQNYLFVAQKNYWSQSAKIMSVIEKKILKTTRSIQSVDRLLMIDCEVEHIPSQNMG